MGSKPRKRASNPLTTAARGTCSRLTTGGGTPNRGRWTRPVTPNSDLARELAETNSGESNVLLVVDQAEELITRTGSREQQYFLDMLDGALSDTTSPLWAVATLRSEFLSTSPQLAEMLDAVVVGSLSHKRLVRLEPLDMPDRFRRWQWVDLFHESGYERLLRALRARATNRPDDPEPLG